MTGALEGGVQVATGFMDALKREPLSLALVVMNLCLLAFFYVLLTTVATQRASEIALLYADKKEVRELLSKCVVPERRTEQQYDAAPIADPNPEVEQPTSVPN